MLLTKATGEDLGSSIDTTRFEQPLRPYTTLFPGALIMAYGPPLVGTKDLMA